MKSKEWQPQSLGMVLLKLTFRGLLYGVLVAGAAAACGYFLGPHNKAALLNGVNWAGTGLAMLAGAFVLGHNNGNVAMRGMQQSSRLNTDYSWPAILMALVASVTCFLIWFGVNRFWLAH